jgi:hypothetical protein
VSSSIRSRDRVSHPYKTGSKIIVLNGDGNTNDSGSKHSPNGNFYQLLHACNLDLLLLVLNI